jgi:hypothetical protein
VVYRETELDAPAMALCGLSDHAPVSVERRGNCGLDGKDDCGSGRQSDGADTIADHGVLLLPALKAGVADDWLARMDESSRRV